MLQAANIFTASTSPFLDAESRDRYDLELMARRLYILAWVIEGVAVLLGLGMALSLNLSSENTFAEFLLGGGGFVMVACAELSKIPLATFFVETTQRRAKLATLAFLALMSFITFETIFMSLERGFNSRMLAVNSQKAALSQSQTEHAKLSKFIADPGGDVRATRQAIEDQLAQVDKALKTELDAIAEERRRLRGHHQDSQLPKEIDAQLAALDTKLKTFTDERDRKIAEADERARKWKDSLLRERANAIKAGDTVRAGEIARKIDALNSRSERVRVEVEYQKKLAEVEAERKTLIDQRALLVRESETTIKPRLDELASSEQRIQLEFAAKRASLHQSLDENRALEKQLMARVVSMTKLRDDLAAEIERKQWDLHKTTSESQLHRLTPAFVRWWTGAEYEAHTIPDTYVRSVAVIWFGSMAALGAIGGSVVAMVSQLLSRRARKVGTEGVIPAPENIARQKFWLTLRRLLLQWRWYRVRKEPQVRTETTTVTKIIAVPVPTAESFESYDKKLADVNSSLQAAANS